MHAVTIPAPGADPVPAEFPEPPTTGGLSPSALVAAGVHPVVRAMATGSHYGSTRQYPFVPGVDAVARTDAGTRVYTGMARPPWGTFAEHLATPFAVELPTGADPLAVAAGVNPGLSAWVPLTRLTGETGRLGRVLVLGATGIAGSMAVEAACALGADEVLAAGIPGDRLDLVAGRSRSVRPVALSRSDRGANAAALATAWDGHPPSIVLDYLWGAAAEATFDALRRRGMDADASTITYVQIGDVAGPEVTLPSQLLRSRRLLLRGSGAGSLSREDLARGIPQVIDAICTGALTARHTAYPMHRIAEAWAHRGPSRAVVVPD